MKPAIASPGGLLRQRAVRAWWTLKAHAYVDRAGGPEGTTVLLGSARSGTTWLAELIDRHHDHHVVFEPFLPDRVPAMEPFRGRPYLRPDEADPTLAAAAEDVLLGRVRNAWTDHTTRAVVARRRLVKEVRANCLAGWLARRMPGARLVLLVRHPLAVVASRLELGWPDRLDLYLADGDLVADHAGDHAMWLAAQDHPVVRGVAQWAIETAVPLRQLAAGEVLAVEYEALRSRPEEVGGSVLAWVGQELDDTFRSAAGRSSRTARPPGDDSTSPVQRLRARLDGEQLDGCRRALDAFGVASLYDLERDEPHPGALARALAAGG